MEVYDLFKPSLKMCRTIYNFEDLFSLFFRDRLATNQSFNISFWLERYCCYSKWWMIAGEKKALPTTMWMKQQYKCYQNIFHLHWFFIHCIMENQRCAKLLLEKEKKFTMTFKNLHSSVYNIGDSVTQTLNFVINNRIIYHSIKRDSVLNLIKCVFARIKMCD